MVSNTSEPGRAGSLPLIGGALALDFAHTASGRGAPSALDHLRDADDVVTWAIHAGIADAEAGERLRAHLGAPAFAGLLPRALRLREAIHDVVAAISRGAEPPAPVLAEIGEACATGVAAARLHPTAQGFAWAWPDDPPLPETVLGPIALSAVGLLREGDPARLKQCAGEACGWVFLDLSKNRSRRWCEMSVCGNRAKARRHVRRAPRAEEA